MKRFSVFAIATVVLVALAWSDLAQAGEGSLLGWKARRQAPCTSWNGGYYDANWGLPLAVVVPPTAERQVNYGWGVGNMRVTPIYHQFHRNYPGGGQYQRGMYRPVPARVSDTQQFGYYYVRGPW